MARIRTIKPQFFTNEQLADLPPIARIFFIGLWCLADRAGRLEDRPRRIKAEILPYDEANADNLLDQLASAQLIIRYEAQGAKYIEILSFTRHQHCHVNEPQSAIPEPSVSEATSEAPKSDRSTDSTIQAPCEHDTSTVLIGQEQEQEGNRKGTEILASVAEATSASGDAHARAREGGPAEGEATSEAPKKPRARQPQFCDDAYLDELQADPAFAALDVRLLHAKMERWCKTHGKQPTRNRFVAWLMREDQPSRVSMASQGGDRYSRSKTAGNDTAIADWVARKKQGAQ